MNMTKRVDWSQYVDIREYYKRVIRNAKITGEQITGCCPLHDDGNASFSANLATGLWTCFSRCGSGNIVKLHAKLQGVEEAQAARELKAGKIPATDGKPQTERAPRTVPMAEVQKHHEALLRSKEALEHLQKDRGLTLETIKKHRLGFDGNRVWIPIIEDSSCYNVKRHLFRGPGEKSLSYAPGMGSARLFPEIPKEGPIYITEGEYKALLMSQMGFPAVTSTSGAKSWKDEWTPLFAGRDVYVCFDIDKAGKEGALTVARKLRGVATVRVVELPISEPANADFPDYILRHGYTAEDFKKLCDSTPVFQPRGKQSQISETEAPRDITLGRVAEPENYFKRVRVAVTVSGKDLTPYVAPKCIEVGCALDMGDKCNGCPMQSSPNGPGLIECEFDALSPEVLKLIRVNDDQQMKHVKKKLGLPPCRSWEINVKDTWKVEEVSLIPEVTYSDTGNPYVTRTAYSLVPNEIKTNQGYTMVGVSVPDPETQHSTLVITEAVPQKTSVETFKLTPEIAKELEVFRAKPGQVAEKIDSICVDLTNNVTRIWGREDLIQTFLLVSCSVRKFEFAGQMLDKGWLEGLIIGDTRTGKSETMKRLMREVQLGEFITGENLSKAGLIGGLQQLGSGWRLTWGALPLNNGGMVCIDETSGIPEEVIGDFSGIRSSGIAEITKIQREKTDSQVRIIWVSNPRKGRFSGYAYGVHAVKELFVKPEDIARLDFAVSAAEGEVSLSEINALHVRATDRKFSGEAIRSLILFAWSRRPEDIVFTDDAIKECMAAASRMAKSYSPEIPLAEPAEQRIKIARLSVACAILSFACGKGGRVLVERDHVAWAESFLNGAYSKPSMGYDLYSSQALKDAHCTEDEKEELKANMVHFKEWRIVRDAFLENPHGIRQKYLASKTGMDQGQLQMLFSWMGQNGLYRDTPVGFKPTAKFVSVLRDLLTKDPPEPKNPFGVVGSKI